MFIYIILLTYSSLCVKSIVFNVHTRTSHTVQMLIRLVVFPLFAFVCLFFSRLFQMTANQLKWIWLTYFDDCIEYIEEDITYIQQTQLNSRTKNFDWFSFSVVCFVCVFLWTKFYYILFDLFIWNNVLASTQSDWKHRKISVVHIQKDAQ